MTQRLTKDIIEAATVHVAMRATESATDSRSYLATVATRRAVFSAAYGATERATYGVTLRAARAIAELGRML